MATDKSSPPSSSPSSSSTSYWSLTMKSAVAAGVALLGAWAFASPAGPDVSINSVEGAPQFHNDALHEAADPYTFWDAKEERYFSYSTAGADPGHLFAIYTSPDLATWHKEPGGVLKACYDQDGNKIPGGQACWARDWQWAPEVYYNEKTGWYFFIFAGRLTEDLTAQYFRYSAFEEPSKLGMAKSRSPWGPFEEIDPENPLIDWLPYDNTYHDVNLLMEYNKTSNAQLVPPQTLKEGKTAYKGTFIPTIDPNIYFAPDGSIYLYASRNAYRNWNWDEELGKYIEESNIIGVELTSDWWHDEKASQMPQIVDAAKDASAAGADPLPANITSYYGTGTIGHPSRMDAFTTVISYGADPQEWENQHVNDYDKFGHTKKNRRWSEGSTVISRPKHGKKKNSLIYIITYSANNFEAEFYGIGFATAEHPLGPYKKSVNNPILKEDPSMDPPIFSTGHGSIVASPPRKNGKTGKGCGKGHEGPQEVTVDTPAGAELFYVHHGRPSTDSPSRYMYTTRMSLNPDAVYFRSDDAISMHLTSHDQDLPLHTYPISISAECKASKNHFDVEVTSKGGVAGFDIAESSNRVVGSPGDIEYTAITQSGSYAGMAEITFPDKAKVHKLTYQRMMADGSWMDVASTKVKCNK